jgi:Uma2 family endonuclease
MIEERTFPDGVGRVAYGNRWTAADLATLSEDVETGTILWELWDGEFYAARPPAIEHSIAQTAIGLALHLWCRSFKCGCSYGSRVGLILPSERGETVVAMEAGLVLPEQFPKQLSPQDWLVTIPAILAEVRDRRDRPEYSEEKVRRYLAAGARLVWDVDPARRQVTEHRPSVAPVVFEETDTLTAEGIIEGFALPLQKLFRDWD